MKQNITLSIEKDLLKKGKIIAASRETSLSKMLSEELEKMIKEAEHYEICKRKALADLKKGFHLGWTISSSREELHKR
jgi:hypothetical protein